MGFSKSIAISILATLLVIQCKTKSKEHYQSTFSIEVRHFAGAAGLTIYYIVNERSVQVDTDCDFENCKRKTVYKRELRSEESDKVLEGLQGLRLDTLKKEYRPKGIVFDGLVSSIKIHGSKLPDKEISIDNVNLPATDSLYRLIDGLIVIKKYQFYHFGRE